MTIVAYREIFTYFAMIKRGVVNFDHFGHDAQLLELGSRQIWILREKLS